MTKIHPTAVISPKANLGADVEIGAYCVVENDVSIGANTKLRAHIVIAGNTQVGSGCDIYPFASIGLPPQDLKYRGENSRTIIGNNTTIRENVTINSGTEGGQMETRIGDDCFFMACSHVAHDCIVKNNVIVANGVLLAGHCLIDDYVFIGGNTAVAQFLRLGAHAFITGSSGVGSDLPPFVSVMGIPAIWRGVNVIGLKRRGFCSKDINEIRKFYNVFFKMKGTPQERIEILKAEHSNKYIDEIIRFIEKGIKSKKSILQSRKN